MDTLSNLAIFILAAQGFASVFLALASIWDIESFEKLNSDYHAAFPGLMKIVRLLRMTQKNVMMGVYFLSLVFVILSYAAAVLLVIQVINLIIS